MSNKTRTLLIIVILAGALAGAFWWWNAEGQYRQVEFVPNDPEFSSPEEYERYYEALERAYAEDEYGGDTPEETLELFIEALKAEDIELASKYFVVEKQEYVKENLPRSFESGAAEGIIKAYEEGVVKETGENIVKFELLPKGEEVGYIFRLILNEQTGKWKLYEL